MQTNAWRLALGLCLPRSKEEYFCKLQIDSLCLFLRSGEPRIAWHERWKALKRRYRGAVNDASELKSGAGSACPPRACLLFAA